MGLSAWLLRFATWSVSIANRRRRTYDAHKKILFWEDLELTVRVKTIRGEMGLWKLYNSAVACQEG